MYLKITDLRLKPHLPEANELIILLGNYISTNEWQMGAFLSRSPNHKLSFMFVNSGFSLLRFTVEQKALHLKW